MNFVFGTEVEFIEGKLLFDINSAAKPVYGILSFMLFC
jgi:hypothetical protein